MSIIKFTKNGTLNNTKFREFDSHPLLKRLTGLIKPIFFCQILNFILHVPLKYGIIESPANKCQ